MNLKRWRDGGTNEVTGFEIESKYWEDLKLVIDRSYTMLKNEVSSALECRTGKIVETLP